jgi:hypothetical protein
VDTEAWEFQPITPSQGFAIGESPLRARGIAFVAAMKYAAKKSPGGLGAVLSRLQGDPFRPYYDQLFIMNGDYDASALLRLFNAAAELERRPRGRFIVERSRETADVDVRGVYKLLLGKPSPQRVAERLPIAFERYFAPCAARPLLIEELRFETELSRIPVQMSGLYVNASCGFVTRCLELAGAADVTFEPTATSPGQNLHGLPTVSVRFTATWRA